MTIEKETKRQFLHPLWDKLEIQFHDDDDDDDDDDYGDDNPIQ